MTNRQISRYRLEIARTDMRESLKDFSNIEPLKESRRSIGTRFRAWTAAVAMVGSCILANSCAPSLNYPKIDHAGEYAKVEKRLEKCDKAIESDTGSAKPYYERAQVLLKAARYSLALRDLDKAIALDPGSAEAHSAKGRALAGIGKTEEALEVCDKAIALDSMLVDAHIGRARALNSLGRYQDALEASERAVEVDSTSSDAYAMRSFAISSGRYTRVSIKKGASALDDASKAIDLDSSNFNAHNAYGGALVSGGFTRETGVEAIKHFCRAVEIDPQDPVGYANRAGVLEALGLYGQAFEDLNVVMGLTKELVASDEEIGAARWVAAIKEAYGSSLSTNRSYQYDWPDFAFGPECYRGAVRLEMVGPSFTIPQICVAAGVQTVSEHYESTWAPGAIPDPKVIGFGNLEMVLRTDNLGVWRAIASGHWQNGPQPSSLSSISLNIRQEYSPIPIALAGFKVSGQPGAQPSIYTAISAGFDQIFRVVGDARYEDGHWTVRPGLMLGQYLGQYAFIAAGSQKGVIFANYDPATDKYELTGSMGWDLSRFWALELTARFSEWVEKEGSGQAVITLNVSLRP